VGGGWWSRFGAKNDFLRLLAKRAGYPWPLTLGDPFTFQTVDNRWTRIDQLEAVVEFYRNFADPWVKNGDPPKAPGDTDYITVSLRQPSGTAAQIVTSDPPTVKLDGEPDLRWVLPNPAANQAQGAASPGYPQPRRYLYDTLWLEADTQRPRHLYRIMSVDHANHIVTLDKDQPGAPGPKFPDGTATSNWKINTRPHLVLIDSFGARWQWPAPGQPVKPDHRLVPLAGNKATVDANDNQLLHLDGAPDLSRVNPHFDTIYLPADTVTGRGLPQRAYRITDVPANAGTVRVDGAPVLAGGSSAWNIPAGLSADAMPPPFRPALTGDDINGFKDRFDPEADAAHPERARRGHDHYDGVLFLVHRDTVLGWYRWSSYTSRDHGSWDNVADWRSEMSSLQGNQPYFFYSYRSPGQGPGPTFRNYTLMVTDPRNGNSGISWGDPPNNFGDPSVQESLARYYYGKPDPNNDTLSGTVESDDNGKEAVEFHRGNYAPHNTGSGGCLVSPSHIDLRNDLISLYLTDYKVFHGMGYDETDAYMRDLRKKNTYDLSQDKWNGENADNGRRDYNKKLAGILWLIRPDELPLGDPTR
jgi:hypothetical protein